MVSAKGNVLATYKSGVVDFSVFLCGAAELLLSERAHIRLTVCLPTSAIQGEYLRVFDCGRNNSNIDRLIAPSVEDDGGEDIDRLHLFKCVPADRVFP